MNKPFDDNSALSGDSQLDGLIHQLGLDSHQHSNLQSSESAVDLDNFLQHLDSASNSLHTGSETEYPSQHHSLHHSGSEKPHFSTQNNPFHQGLNEGGIHHSLLNHSDNSPLLDRSVHPLTDSFHSSRFEHLNNLYEPEINSHLTSNPDLHPTHLSSFEATHSEPSFSTYHLANNKGTLHYTDSGAITTNDSNSIEFRGNDVWWHGYSRGQAGTVDGHKFYRNRELIGRLGADMNVYDADGNRIGYVTPSGEAYTLDKKLFARGDTARWAAATLVFNTCTQS